MEQRTADSLASDGLADDATEVRSTLESGVDFALQRIDENVTALGPNEYPEAASDQHCVYETKQGPSGWTPAFWTGLCWLGDVLADDDRYRETATGHLEPFRERLEGGDDGVLTHDLGFLYTLAAWANVDRTGDERARQTALRAADLLAERFHPAPGIIQSWGDHRPGSETVETDRYGLTIVDCMMNLPLLYRASAHTGYDHLHDVAATHAATTAEFAIREDGSTAHGIGFDVETGAFEGEQTHQGAADDSCWARGQAWTIYGMALSYRHTGREAFRNAARHTAEYYLEKVPADWVPPWDFDAEQGVDDRDSSAAAIAANGFFELAEHLPPSDPDRQRLERAGLATLESLTADYTTEGNDDANGILDEGAYNWNNGAYDQSTIWGDYYYLEGLVRALEDWTPWWARDAQ